MFCINIANMTNKTKVAGFINNYSVLPLFFALVFGYFFWFGNHIFFFQENQSLFLYSGQYFHGFINKPGGFIVLLGKFITQFYTNVFTGSILLATLYTALFYLFTRLFRNWNNNTSLSQLFALLPSCLLVLMQARYYHFMEANLGYLSVCFSLHVQFTLTKEIWPSLF